MKKLNLYQLLRLIIDYNTASLEAFRIISPRANRASTSFCKRRRSSWANKSSSTLSANRSNKLTHLFHEHSLFHDICSFSAFKPVFFYFKPEPSSITALVIKIGK